jgi:hypothetical protein
MKGANTTAANLNHITAVDTTKPGLSAYHLRAVGAIHA